MGEHDAVFEELVSSRYNALLRCAYLLTADREAARDLVQSALTKAYAKRFGVREPAAMEQYVRRCIVTVHISAWRRHRGRETQFAELPELGYEPSAGLDASLDVWRALRTLPPRQRTAIVLRYFEDRTVTEAAQLMDCSEASVKTHTSRGLARLRVEMGEAAHADAAKDNDSAATGGAGTQALEVA
jgi:RNA polymerase sigma-70 factor (sigma-E family)